MKSRTFQFATNIDAPGAASDALLSLVDEWALPLDVVDQMLLAVGEAVGNALEHGNAFDESKTIHVQVALNDKTASVCVQDEGEGISAERLQTSHLPDDPLSTEGRGLYIIRQVAHRVWLEEEGRRVCMRWDLTDGQNG